MVTRLQSDKGSFVQSPKGAFDGEEVAPPGLTINGDVTANAGAPFAQEMISGGDCQPQFLSVGSYDMIFTALIADGGVLPSIPPIDFTTGIFTDITTGSTWDMSAPPYSMSQLCLGTNNWGSWDPAKPEINGTREHIEIHTASQGAINIATNHGVEHPTFTALGRWKWEGPAP